MEKLEFRKLTADDVEARVQSADEKGFMLLIYKNARVDQNILDETVGSFGWQNKYEEYKGNLYCSVGIKNLQGEFIWKSNCGTESNTEKEKGEASDAFKRACFNWGIGRELYSSPKIKIKGHTISKSNKYMPEYYAFNVDDLQVTDTYPRKISSLKIIGKSMQNGYHEDVIFEFSDNNKTQIKEKNTSKTASPKQVELLSKAYTGENLTKLLEANNISKLEDISLKKASELITKIYKKDGE